MHCVLIVAGKEGFGGDNCTEGTYRDRIHIRTHNAGNVYEVDMLPHSSPEVPV